MLARAGLTAETVSDGEQAVERIAGRRCDLVLTDCQMPGMNDQPVQPFGEAELAVLLQCHLGGG